MTPEKRAETPGAEKVAGLSQIYKIGSLPRAVDAARPKATLVDSESADEELTNLNWLHESTNLLTNFSFGSKGLPIVSPLYDIEGDDAPCLGPSCYQSLEKKPTTSKPPYSFSLLIYMAIEHSPSKCLPVKEIYSWILDRFPYFATAPTGWKNSVRHNLSLNKCFQKVERSHGKVNGKGSLWCVDPEYKPSLMQALKKQSFSSPFNTPPASPQSGSLSPHYLSSILKPNQVQTLKGEQPLPLATTLQKKRTYGSAFDPLAGSIDPQADHNYSASGLAAPRCASPSSVSSLSSVEDVDVFEFVPKSGRTGSHGSQGLPSEEDTDGDSEDDPLADSGYASASASASQASTGPDPSGEGPPGPKRDKAAGPEIDEELKEAAGSLLHLAGIRTCLGSLLGSVKTQSQKPRKK